MDAREVDWPRYDRLKAEGRSGRQIAKLLGLPESTLRDALKRRQALARQEGAPSTGPVQSAVQDAVQMHRSSAEPWSSAEPLAVQSAV